MIQMFVVFRPGLFLLTKTKSYTIQNSQYLINWNKLKHIKNILFQLVAKATFLISYFKLKY